MEKNTQQPVAWLKYPKKKPELMQVSLQKLLPVALKNSGWVSEPLYTAQPVPRDVLMAFGDAVRDAVKNASRVEFNKYASEDEVVFDAIDLAAIADSYASHVHHCCKNCEGIQPETCAFNGGNTQPEPVNQQMLAALKMVLDDPDALDGRPRTYKCVMEAIDAAEAEQPVAVPDGYALVPIDPTAEMLGAADRIEWADSDVVGNYYNMWNAMLAATEQPK